MPAMHEFTGWSGDGKQAIHDKSMEIAEAQQF